MVDIHHFSIFFMGMVSDSQGPLSNARPVPPASTSSTTSEEDTDLRHFVTRVVAMKFYHRKSHGKMMIYPP